MAVFTFLLASLTALLTSFLSLSGTAFHGLMPWMDLLGARPTSSPPVVSLMSPSPVAIPTASYASDPWEAIPTGNLSVSPLDTWEPTRTGNFSGSNVTVLAPAPTFSLLSEEKVGGHALSTSSSEEPSEEPSEDPPEEPSMEEAFWELWWISQRVLLFLTLKINDFVKEHPLLPDQKTSCRFPRVYQLGVQKQDISCLSAVPFAPAPVPSPSPLPASPRLPSPLPASPRSSPPLPASLPLSSPEKKKKKKKRGRKGKKGPKCGPELSKAQSCVSSTDQNSRPPIVEQLLWDTERGQQRNRIGELEDEVNRLKSELEELRRRKPDPVPAIPAPPSSSPPPPSMPHTNLTSHILY